MTDADSNPNAPPDLQEAITFTSSANGARLYCMRTQVYGAFILVILIKVLGDGGSHNGPEFWAYEAIIIAYLVLTALLYHHCPPPSLRMRITIDGDDITLEKRGQKVTIPVAALRRIDIKRSAWGRHRIICLWHPNGALVTLVSPTRGALLEWWAARRAAREGVPFWIANSLYLTLEPISTFILTLLIGAFASALFVT